MLGILGFPVPRDLKSRGTGPSPIVLSFDSWIIHFAKTKILQIQTELITFFSSLEENLLNLMYHLFYGRFFFKIQ